MAFQPKYSITNNLLTYISSIESAKAIIDHSPLIPAWENKFRDEATARIVHYGTKIEGNDLSEEQAEQVVRLENETSTQAIVQKTGIMARERDIQEVLNYRNVVQWINKWEQAAKKDTVLSLDTLHTLHQLTMYRLFEDTYIGQFRDRQVVVHSASDGSVAFRPPVATEVRFLVEDFITWLQGGPAGVHPILQAAITHYQLVYIHPYMEGNGRTARAFATLVLYVHQYDFKRFFSLEQYFDSDVDAYYQALLSVQHNNHDLTYWLEYFCYGLAIEIDKVKRQVEKISRDLKLKKELGKQVPLSERQLLILELFQTQEKITSQDAQHVLPNVSMDTVLRDIKDLMNKGVVRKQGVTKGVTYQLNE